MLSKQFTRLFSSIQSGTKHTLAFKNYLKLPSGKIGSYFHDVPLSLDLNKKTVSMVVEIAKQTHGKFEISKEIKGNPIVQDTKKGKLRFIKNVFPFVGYPVNYGAIPQTWEDPTFVALDGLKGDNDPLDVVEIGDVKASLGQVKKVKVLGCLGLIDDGELDWKIVAVDVNDKRANELNDINDVKTKMPGLLSSLREWFRTYKIPDGKPLNEFTFYGEFKNSDYAVKVIEECNQRWEKLVKGEFKGSNVFDVPTIQNVAVNESAEMLDEFANVELQEVNPDAELPQDLQTTYYCKE